MTTRYFTNLELQGYALNIQGYLRNKDSVDKARERRVLDDTCLGCAFAERTLRELSQLPIKDATVVLELSNNEVRRKYGEEGTLRAMLTLHIDVPEWKPHGIPTKFHFKEDLGFNGMYEPCGED